MLETDRGMHYMYVRGFSRLPLTAMASICLFARMFSLGIIAVKAAQTENIALGKPAFQSSVTAGGVPGRAVDGNFDRDFFSGSCIHTLHGVIDQWWMVDLQGVYPITDVFIQNRDLYISLHDFVVDVFFSNPLYQYDTGKHTCGNYSGMAPASENVHLTCDTGTVGRFVRVLKLPEFITDPETDVLIICEVVVVSRVNRPCGEVRNLPGSANSSKTSGDQIIHGLSRLQCLHLCYYDYHCHGFNFREPDGICQKITDEDQPMVPNTDWMYYSLI